MSAHLPVAIVGIGCRLPGDSNTKELYYEFLRNKGDGMSEPPPDRWDHNEWGSSRPDEPGKYNSSMCGFINNIDQFDNLEFGISMKEAQHLDPSSRLILEVAHQALLDSGIDYRGSNTGVYIGQLLVSASEVGNSDRYEVSSYLGLGKTISLRSNRVSYTFDLRGPSMMVDSACSSSAMATHMALSAMKLGEIDQALIIGGNVMIQPSHNVMFSKTGILSPTGSSKSFDAAADGYARAEGFGAVVIKRLDKALSDKDTIYSVITGSSINSNGRGVSLTMPKGDMQAKTIRQAYKNANRNPSDAFFVELHATGTAVGDPIEANTAGQIFSEERPSDRVLRIGSVKSNIGHTEGCSFLASLIKVSLMLKRKEIIPNIRFNTPNPKIDFDGWLMKVQTELEQITPEQAAPDGKWVASVASSGIGGSNSHVVLEALETVATSTLTSTDSESRNVADPLYLFVVGTLSGPTVIPWKDVLTTSYQDVTDDKTLRSLSYDLARKSRSSLARSFAIGPALSPDLKFSQPAIVSSDTNPELCLVFSGQGPQHIAMGRGLCDSFPIFLSSVKQCDEILVKSYEQQSFLERTGLFTPGEQAKLPEKGVWPIEEVIYSIVFMQIALVDLIKSLGIEYSCVIGHSIGEIAMGYASGCYSKKTAVGIAAARAGAMAKISNNGSMVALGVCYHRAKYMVKQVLADAHAPGGLWIAAINSPKDVTVAGNTDLIDMLYLHAQDRKIFAAKLRVTCAFHTPLMEACEQDFRTLARFAFTEGISPPLVPTMSTVDADWLERNMDEDYCWDNIRQPVLFGKPVDDIVKGKGSENVVFLEISPHPVLQSYINSCGGKSFSLVQRPNTKLPGSNAGEHYHFLHGIGSLLAAGFKSIDLAKLCTTPDGRQDLGICKLPEYPYNRSKCWSEPPADRSMRLHKKSRPLASSAFRMSCDTHPDLAGHVIFERPIFPASGYLEGIFENGAIVMKNTEIHRPLVLSARGAEASYVGCVLDGDTWKFRVATSNSFENGTIKLETTYAGGFYSRQNPQFDPDNRKRFDVGLKLALSRCHLTGDEFYQAIPPTYGYKDNFSSYIKEIHEIPDDISWGGSAYLIKLEIPEGEYDKGYVIHPSILDSIMHSTLAAFIDMDTKSFDYTETLLPVTIDQITRWDRGDDKDLDFPIHGTIWTYLTINTWNPSGPCKSDLIVVGSESLVLLTMEGMEFAIAPREQCAMDECWTTIWQPKVFPSGKLAPPSTVDLAASSYLCQALETLISNANTAGRQIVRILDLDTSSLLAKAICELLVSIPKDQVFVDYFIAGESPEDADERARDMSYSRARPFLLKPLRVTSSGIPEDQTAAASSMFSEEAEKLARARQAELDPTSGEYPMTLGSFDILFQVMDTSLSPQNIEGFLEHLAPCGVLLLLYNSTNEEKPNSEQLLTHPAFQDIPEQDISLVNINNGETIILIRSGVPLKEDSNTDIVIHHFTRGTEEELVAAVNKLSENSEIWILGDDSPIGIGALGIAACIIAESPNFTVRSLLFEDSSLGLETREEIVYGLRRRPSLLEQHMKYSRTHDVWVRRLAYHSMNLQSIKAPGVSIEVPLAKGQISRYFPPDLKATDVQVSVDSLGINDISADRPLATFVGKVTQVGTDVKDVLVSTRVIGIAKHPITDIIVLDQNSITALPSDVPDPEAVALPIIALIPWLALAEYTPISNTSVVLLYDANTHVGFGAVQICQRFDAKFFCAVPTSADKKRLAEELNVDEQAISTSAFTNEVTLAAKMWLSKNGLLGFDAVFNLTGGSMDTTVLDLLKATGQYIHNKSNIVGKHDILSDAPVTRLIDIPKLAEFYPSTIASSLTNLLATHISAPFKLQSHSTTMSQLSSLAPCMATSKVLVVAPDTIKPIDTNTSQLFNPRKTYLLVGGSSELGVRISVWMANRGARRIILTSRRGSAALGKMDRVYLHHLQSLGISVDIIAADARNVEDMKSVINHANSNAQIAGIFLMTVVSRDGMFSGMKQESFDEVYISKVTALHTLLRLVNPTTLDFLLLFSTIGSVFGNAGQSAYCASQLYLDRIAESLPNTTSISLPPISDSGMFKRLLMSSKGRSSSKMAMKIGITTAQACDFIADSIVRRIPHYVPAIAIKNVPMVFSNCERLLYNHLLPPQFLIKETNSERSIRETPASLLSELLGLGMDQISNDVTLKDYGLDSLGAIRYSKELEGHFGVKVSQLELLGSMNIGLLDNMVASNSKTKALPMRDGGNSDTNYRSAPETNLAKQLAFGETFTTKASYLQSRIWHSYEGTNKSGTSGRAEEMHSHKNNAHGLFLTISSPTAFNTSRFNEAFAEVIQRHGILRTALFESQGELKQCVYPFLDFEINVIDLKAEDDAEGKAQQLTSDECERFELKLEKLPMFIATAFDLGNGMWSFSFVTHPIVLDPPSLGLIIRELVTLYHNGINSLDTQDIHYSDVSDWLFYNANHRAKLQTRQRKFWTETLVNVQPMCLLSPTPSEHALSSLTQVKTTMDASTLSLFHNIMDETKATPSEGFFAIYNVALHTYSSQETIVVGMAVTQRSTPALANVAGPLTTFLPIKTTVDLNKTLLEYFLSFKENLSESLENHDVAYYEDINPRDASMHPRSFRHSFSYDGINLDALSRLEIENMEVKTIHTLSKTEEDQEFLLDVYGTGRLILRFNNYMFSSEDAMKFLDTYTAVIKALCNSPNSKMCDVQKFWSHS